MPLWQQVMCKKRGRTVAPVSRRSSPHRRSTADTAHTTSCNTRHRSSQQPSTAAFATGSDVALLLELLQDLRLLVRHIVSGSLRLRLRSLHGYFGFSEERLPAIMAHPLRVEVVGGHQARTHQRKNERRSKLQRNRPLEKFKL